MRGDGDAGERGEKKGKGASIFGHYSKRGRTQTRYKGAGVEIHRYKGARLEKEKGRGSWRKVSGILVGGGWEIDKGGGSSGASQDWRREGLGAGGEVAGGAEGRGRKAALRKGRHAAGTGGPEPGGMGVQWVRRRPPRSSASELKGLGVGRASNQGAAGTSEGEGHLPGRAEQRRAVPAATSLPLRRRLRRPRRRR